jgi:hypothetical protein
MVEQNELHTHLWCNGNGLRRVEQDGKVLFHRKCLRCGRDFSFGQGADGLYRWQGVYVGIFRIERLTRDSSEKWLREPCPGEIRAEDYEVRAMRIEPKPQKFDP